MCEKKNIKKIESDFPFKNGSDGNFTEGVYNKRLKVVLEKEDDKDSPGVVSRKLNLYVSRVHNIPNIITTSCNVPLFR